MKTLANIFHLHFITLSALIFEIDQFQDKAENHSHCRIPFHQLITWQFRGLKSLEYAPFRNQFSAQESELVH